MTELQRLCLSTAHPADPAWTHVVLGAAPDMLVGTLAETLARRTGGPTADLFMGPALLDPGARLDEVPLHDGCVLGVGAPAASSRTAAPRGRGPVLAELRAVSGPGAGHVFALRTASYDVGSLEGCAIRLAQEGVPGHAVVLAVAPDGVVTAAPGTDPGALVDDEVLTEQRPCPIGTQLTLGTVLLEIAAPSAADAAVQPSQGELGVDYNRPPRIHPLPVSHRFRMPTPPSRPARRPLPVLMTIAPLAMGIAMAVLFRRPYFLLFAFFSPVMAVASYINDRRHGKHSYRRQRLEYLERLDAVEDDIARAVRSERLDRRSANPDPAQIALTACGPGRRLWERRRTDTDRLVLRVGTADQPSSVVVESPASEASQPDDPPLVRDAPVLIPFADVGVVGVAGPDSLRLPLCRWLIAQASALHSSRDLRLYLLSPSGQEADWDWIRWLPHARPWSGEGPAATVGTDPETVGHRVTELVALIEERTRARQSAFGAAGGDGPDIMVVLDGARGLRDVPGIVQVLQEGPAVGVFSICLDRLERLLPEEAHAVVAADAGALTVHVQGHEPLHHVRPDLVDAAWCERVARSLAPVRDVSAGDEAALPQSVRLLDLLDSATLTPAAVCERWTRHPSGTSVVLGAGYTNPFTVDLVRDGPHALVAGTTGAGKSELLQSLVVSLATVNRPDELAFVLVDYKGGSAFKDCARLPHVLGMVTDLDAHLTERALESLGAELRRREQVLAAAGAKDVEEYQAMRAADPALPALGRLVLVIDEFATLVREVERFVPGLVGIAQRGRSLGLHLVLATQRPTGVVNGDIRANTNLRIALRVTDASESHDVIDCHDAVTISASTPGRALARLGHGQVVPFQAGFVGTVHGDRPSALPPGWVDAVPWHQLGRPTAAPPVSATETHSPGPTDLSRLVNALSRAAADLGLTRAPSPWLPPLPDLLLLDDLPAPAGTGDLPAVPYGLLDEPADQRQSPLVVDFTSFGHLSVLGAPRSGRSQVLRTLAGAMARAHSCADVHLYGIDAAGGALTVLQDLPHCGAVVPRGDLERVERLLTRLTEDLHSRQAALAEHSAANVTELRSRLPVGLRPSHVVVMVDGWDALSAVLTEFDGGRLLEQVVQLIREGAAAGIHLVMTSDRALMGGRVGSLNDARLLLRLPERTDYTSIGLSSSRLPAVVRPGMGWLAPGGSAVQVAVLDADRSGQGQADGLRRIAEAANTRDAGVPDSLRPGRIASLPASIGFADALQQVPEAFRRPLWAMVGVGGDDLSVRGVDLAGRSGVCAVAGPAGSGRSTLLLTMGLSLLAGGTRLIVLAPRPSPVRRLAGMSEVLAVMTESNPAAADLHAALSAATGPTALLVDDADLLDRSGVDAVLREIVATGRDRAVGLVYAGTGDLLGQVMMGWLGDARRARQGVLLSPQSMVEGDLIGARLSPDLVRRPLRPGRAYLADPRSGAPVAVLVPHTTLRVPGARKPV
ncbi:S-DNA-T family DNA segregation ATPase FtsK/SpoIIIE [Streptomyces sp. TLI_235]|nr:FtsK/SpoIIIE domain-containing protein [Streptomyces sp. TLI_235]PBC69571.1 S-DNA-T family DNA segregation ATPase FtsK/SpoIIIE [Streptomyces sp. TLI_235]